MNNFSTRFGCSFPIFSTRFECSFQGEDEYASKIVNFIKENGKCDIPKIGSKCPKPASIPEKLSENTLVSSVVLTSFSPVSSVVLTSFSPVSSVVSWLINSSRVVFSATFIKNRSEFNFDGKTVQLKA